MPYEPKPRKGRAITTLLSPEFVKDAEARRVDPARLATRLRDLVLELDREARELFEDWDARSDEEQSDFVLGGVRARADLEFPRLS